MPLAVVAAVLISALLHATWNGVLRNSHDRAWTVSWIGASTFIVCAPFLPFVGFPTKVWPFVLTSAVLRVLYIVLLGRTYKQNELSFAYPITRGMSPLLVMLGGLLIASEVPRWVQLVGILLVVGGILAVGLDAPHADKKGVRLAIAVGVIIAIYTTIDGLGARRSGLPLQYNLWCFSSYGLAILVLKFARRGRNALGGPVKGIAWAFGAGVLFVASYALATWAMVHAQLGAVSALRETSILFAAVIGLVFLHERFSHQKMFGCIAIAAGAVLIGMH